MQAILRPHLATQVALRLDTQHRPLATVRRHPGTALHRQVMAHPRQAMAALPLSKYTW